MASRDHHELRFSKLSQTIARRSVSRSAAFPEVPPGSSRARLQMPVSPPASSGLSQRERSESSLTPRLNSSPATRRFRCLRAQQRSVYAVGGRSSPGLTGHIAPGS